jgi:hypothetical protein
METIATTEPAMHGESPTGPAFDGREVRPLPGVAGNLLELIGNTPMTRLPKLNRGLRPTLLAKLEMFNPGNNVKDRIGIRMIRDAEARGLL